MDNMAATVALLWNPQVIPKRGPRPTLTFEAIAQAGIDIADRVGLAGLTMQGVAESLAVTKMALYRYLPGKSELISLMVDVGVGEPPAASDGDWRAQLTQWSRELFDRFRHHPWALEATLGVRAIGPNELGWTEAAVATLSGIGLNGSEILDAAVTLVGHVRSLAQQVTAVTNGDAGVDVQNAPGPELTIDASLGLLLRGRESRYPALAAALDSTVVDGGQDQALEFGLRLILDGIAALLATRQK